MGCGSSAPAVGTALPSSLREMRLFSEANLNKCLQQLKDDALFGDSASMVELSPSSRAGGSPKKSKSKRSTGGSSRSPSKKVHPGASGRYDGILGKGSYELTVRPKGTSEHTHVVESIRDELEAVAFGMEKRVKQPGREHIAGVPKDCVARAEALVMVLHHAIHQKHLRFSQAFDFESVEGCLPFDIPKKRIIQILGLFNRIDTNKLGNVRWEDLKELTEEMDEDVAASVFYPEVFKLHHRGRPRSHPEEMTAFEFVLNTITYCMLDAEDLEQVAFEQMVGSGKSGSGQPAFDSRTITTRFPALESKTAKGNHYNSSLGRAIKEMIVKGCGLGPDGALIDRDVFLRICDKTPVVLFPLKFMQKFFRDCCGGMSWWEKFAADTRKEMLSKRGEGGLLHRLLEAQKKGQRKVYRRRSVVLDGKEECSDDEGGPRMYRLLGNGRRASAEFQRQRGRSGASHGSPMMRKGPVTSSTEEGDYKVRGGGRSPKARAAAADASLDTVLGKIPKRKSKSRSVSRDHGDLILHASPVYDSDSSDGSIQRSHSTALATASKGTIATHSLHTLSHADIRAKRPHGHRSKSKRHHPSKRGSLTYSKTATPGAMNRRRSQ